MIFLNNKENNENNNSVEERLSWEANSSSASQEIPLILYKPKVSYRCHESPPLVPVVSQINPIHTPKIVPENRF